MSTFRHRISVGAELLDGATRFRLWAPTARDVKLCLEGRGLEGWAPLPMLRDRDGLAELTVAGVGPGDRYRFLIDDELRVPDPASRRQPEGVHGPSEVHDPCAYTWRFEGWRGRPWHEAVLYELHVGTFTPEGTFAAVIDRLDHLVDLGVTALELMPVAASPGARHWGYDGVQIFAPASAYGHPDDLKRLVDEAHGRGLMVLLDVVYNHFGPEGNYLPRYAGALFTEAATTPWGTAIDVDGAHRDAVRGFFVDNALYWLDEYRFDGLRLDAVHAIPALREPTFVEQLAVQVRRATAGRHVHLVVENDDNRATLLERDARGEAIRHTAQWNDDFHHTLHVLVAGESDGYYRDYPAPLPRLGRCLAEGFGYQGEPSAHRGGAGRGQPSSHLPPTAFVTFVQNHDQVGNRAFGERLHGLCGPEAHEAAFTIALLAPSVPLLFMGEEWAATSPFLFFCDFGDEGLVRAVREGRRGEFADFASFADPEARERIPDPGAPETLAASRLRWGELQAEPHRGVHARYRELLAVRRRDIVPRLPEARSGSWQTEGARLSVRWPLGDAVLGLELNAGLAPVEVACPGRSLATTANATDRWLPRWGVVWWLDEAGADR